MPGQDILAQITDAIAADQDKTAESLIHHLTPEAEPILRQWLQTGNADQQWWAVRALAVCGTAESIPALLAALKAPDPALRTVAALALGTLYGQLALHLTPHLSYLADQLADEDGMARQAAADALIHCGDGAIDALVAVLRHSTHEGARSRAAYALRKIGTPATAPALFRCLNDPNYLVHTYAHEGLDDLGMLETMLVQ